MVIPVRFVRFITLPGSFGAIEGGDRVIHFFYQSITEFIIDGVDIFLCFSTRFDTVN